jgi:hypothetical protein
MKGIIVYVRSRVPGCRAVVHPVSPIGRNEGTKLALNSTGYHLVFVVGGHLYLGRCRLLRRAGELKADRIGRQ